MSKTLIFTATYNEKNNVTKLIEEINKICKDVDILVVDDNSPDNTAEILGNLQKANQNLHIIIREKKLGLDTAHKLAYDYSKKNNYLKLITMDADLSHNPIEIPKIISLLNNKDFVIGSRYILGGKCEMPLPRLILSIVGNKIIKNVLGLKCNEFTTSFRGFNLEKLNNFDLNSIKSKGYSFFMETIYRLNNQGFEIYEIPIYFRNRAQGKSKINKIEIFRTLKNLFLLKFTSNN